MLVLRMVEERFHRDAEGRPIREGRTPPDVLREGEIEYKQCPYSGSRYLHANPMNMSALRQTSAHWDEVVDAVAFLRTAYGGARGGYRADLMDIWRVSQIGSSLPWFYILRRNETCPAYAAALSKATLGTGILAQRLLRKRLAEAWQAPLFTAPVLLELAESTGTLVGEAEVCSAPEKMIAKFLDVLIAGAPRGGLATVDRLLADRDRVLGFGACYCGFKLAVWLYYQARRFLYADVCTARDSAAVRELIEAPCEPPDFFLIEPDHPAAVPPALRAAWFGQLAQLIVPFAPDGSDRAVLACAQQMAAAMGEDARDPIERAITTFARLDAIHGELIACVESGLRGERYTQPIDAATRDRLIAMSPRAVFGALR